MNTRHQIFAVSALALHIALSCSGAANLPPIAIPDAYSVNEDATLSVSSPGVLANDSDPEGNSMSALLVTTTTNGTLTLNSSGSFTYRPLTNFNGVDGFVYRTRDSLGTSAPVTVTITINPVNDAPRATNDAFTMVSDSSLTISTPGVLGNDRDVDGDVLSAVLATNTLRGALALNANGGFSYTPQPGFSGVDSFAYRATDGVATSGVSIVTISVVPVPITVITPPANQTGCVGGSATFSIAATGTALTYQWFKNTTALSGRTNNALSLTNLAASDAATYRVRVTGPTNSITNAATLTVNVPVSATPLSNSLRAVGAPIVFRTTATGTGPFTYSWLKNGELIADANSNSLYLTNLATTDSGTYSVVVMDSCRSITNSATLQVAGCFSEFDVMLVIDRSGSMLGQPYTDARSACTNFVFNLRLHATNDQIGLASFNATGTLNQVLTTNGASMLQQISALPEAAKGTCISCGLLEGQRELESPRHRADALPVLVLLSDGLPHDFDTPSNALYNAEQIKLAGTRVFTVGLGGGVDPVLMAQMASSPNDYFFASDSSQLAGLFDQISAIICRPPTNIFGPHDITTCAGSNVDLLVNATGCNSFTYQWHKNGAPLLNETNSALSIPNARGSNSGVYSVFINGSCRRVTNSALVTILEPAFVISPALPQASYVGSNAVLAIDAVGSGLTYQWTFNGTVVGTNSSLILTQLTRAHDGTYCVAVNGSACGGATNLCTTLTILNRAPMAQTDAYATDEDTALTLARPGVLANDLDLDEDVISAMRIDPPVHGTLELSADGSFTYCPFANFHGVDSFTYRASDGADESATTSVTITVRAVNDTPVAAADDQYVTAEDTALVTSAGSGVLANDFDADGDPLRALLVNTTTNGSLALQLDGSFRYQPNTNFHGIDSFTYRASDGQTSSAITTVIITVLPVNDTPVAANDDQYATVEDMALAIAVPNGVLGNDIDADGDALSAILITTTTNGSLLLDASGAFAYQPNTNFHGVDHFTYRATDGVATSGVAVATIVVVPTNDIPVARDDSYSTDEDLALTIDAPGVLRNDSDVDGDVITTVLVTTTTNGTLVLNANGSFNYRPITNFHGIDAFTYQVTDGLTTSAVAKVTITIRAVNDTPMAANDDQYFTREDTLLVVAPTQGVLINDVDADGDMVQALLSDSTTNGSLTLQTNGEFTYLPGTNFHGVDHFTYRTTDGTATSAIAVVTITVLSVNDGPEARNDSYATDEDVPLLIAAPGVLANDSDQDGDVLSAVLMETTQHGTLALNSVGAFTYTPATNFHGTDSFTYRATDGQTNSGFTTVSIIVRSVNDRPISRSDGGENYSIREDNALAIAAPGVLANDTDEDGDTLTAALGSAPSNGTVVLNADGSFIYRPRADYFGTDSFTYVARDLLTSSAPTTVTIVVRPVNDAPRFVKGANQRLNFNAPMQSIPGWATSLKAGPTNEAAQSLSFVVVNDNPALFSAQPELDADGTLTFTPAGIGFGAATVTVSLRDNGGTTDGGVDTSAEQTFAITLNGAPQVQIVSPISGSVFIGTNNLVIVAEASDPDSVVTNVQIFAGTNLIGTFTNGPYFALLSNVPPSLDPYTFYAVAADDLNLRATSSVVSITATSSPPVSAIGAVGLNKQNGFFEQFVRISNPTPRMFPNGMRLYILIDSTNRVENATGTDGSGVAYIDVLQPLASGSNLIVLVQYYVPNVRAVPDPVLLAEALPFTLPSTPAPVATISRQGPAGVVLQFDGATNRLYYIQSSPDLKKWSTQAGLLYGPGTLHWTNSAADSQRFFRALLLPY